MDCVDQQQMRKSYWSYSLVPILFSRLKLESNKDKKLKGKKLKRNLFFSFRFPDIFKHFNVAIMENQTRRVPVASVSNATCLRFI